MGTREQKSYGYSVKCEIGKGLSSKRKDVPFILTAVESEDGRQTKAIVYTPIYAPIDKMPFYQS